MILGTYNQREAEEAIYMKTIRIMLCFLRGPILKTVIDYDTEEWCTGIDIVDNDEILKQLDMETSQKYNSLFSFGTNNKACEFDENRYRELNKYFLDNVSKIINRLNEINDGSYVVEDTETEWLQQFGEGKPIS